MTGKPFCNHWVHTRFLLVDGEKMSKSKGNFYTVRDLIAKGADPLAIRLALMSTHFTKELNFTEQGLSDASGNVERLRRADAAATAAKESGREGDDVLGAVLADVYDQALEAMLNDLNTSVAVAKALEGARAILREADAMSVASGESAAKFLENINHLLGIVSSEYAGCEPAKEAPAVDKELVEAKIAERAALKKAKNFAAADAIRAELDAMGVELRDTPDGVVWSVKAESIGR